MKTTNQEQDITASFSRLRSATQLPTVKARASSGRLYSSSFRLSQRSCCGARLACEADLSGRHYKAWATADKLSSTSGGWSNGVLERRSDGIEKRPFCGLVLELFARPVITNKTVLPKAAVTAGKMILGLNLSVASAALRDARQRYLWKGEW